VTDPEIRGGILEAVNEFNGSFPAPLLTGTGFVWFKNEFAGVLSSVIDATLSSAACISCSYLASAFKRCFE
jgi:hypothetical protein